LTIDPFLLRGAAVGSAWRAERAGAAGAVYHAVGGGQLPIASGLPVVVTLLDLAPWELPSLFQRSVASRFGQRLRGQLLRDAAAVVVGSDATASAARRLLHIRRDRLHVVRLAPRAGFGLVPSTVSEPSRSAAADLRERLGLANRYLVFTGRFDARLDLETLLAALAALAAAGRPDGLDSGVPWPPRILLVGASPEDRASIARAAARKGIGEALAYAPALPVEDLAGLVRGARAAILPVLSDAAGLPVIEALASGTPVVASSVGPLPGLIGPAGLLVEPRDPHRMAVALAAIWADDSVHDRIAATARERADGDPRSWADVARETRAIYAAVGINGRG
jgi:glycosyltransferase involved in cell wall biosynthesis